MKKVVLFTLLIASSVIFSQNKLKFHFTIDANQQETVIKIVAKDFGKYKEFKKKQVLWQEKAKNFEYKILVKKRKVTFFYKGNDTLVENRIRASYLKVKKIL
ncbi:hypothetical protein [uncultured Polaribacter sp.]|uniref:hypothetical protein n=1 Tax=uncultured Polaribacter sp. TaxID=174711 RepID=UPI0037043E56|tara:strand:+ start:597 stop:902 length:306 start_codon:yes stop_codon:yes gene_type:complete